MWRDVCVCACVFSVPGDAFTNSALTHSAAAEWISHASFAGPVAVRTVVRDGTNRRHTPTSFDPRVSCRLDGSVLSPTIRFPCQRVDLLRLRDTPRHEQTHRPTTPRVLWYFRARRRAGGRSGVPGRRSDDTRRSDRRPRRTDVRRWICDRDVNSSCLHRAITP